MLDIECHDQIRVMLSPDAQLLASEIYGFPVVLERSGNRRDSKDPRVGFPEDHRPSSEPLIAVTIQEEAPHRTGLAREYRNRRLLDEGRGKTLPRCSPTPPHSACGYPRIKVSWPNLTPSLPTSTANSGRAIRNFNAKTVTSTCVSAPDPASSGAHLLPARPPPHQGPTGTRSHAKR